MFEYDSETEFNYEGGEIGKGSLLLGVAIGVVVVLAILVIVASTVDNGLGWMNVSHLWKENAADPKTERLSAVWKNSERLTSKDPEFKGAYERTCGARNN